MDIARKLEKKCNKQIKKQQQYQRKSKFYILKFFCPPLIFFPSISGDVEAVQNILEVLVDPEPLNKNLDTPLNLALQAGHYQEIREVYEDLEIDFLPCTNTQMQFYENSMEWME